MVKVKEMPYSEKFKRVMDEKKFEDTQTFLFIQKHLGDQAVAELQKIHQEACKPVREDAPFEEKYETAFGNWVSSGGLTFGFIRSRLGEEGIERFIRVNVDNYIKENKGMPVYLLNIIRSFSPGAAFSMFVKNMSYETQWFGPASVSEMSRSRLVTDIPHCKILDYPNCEDVCVIGCQKLFPMIFAEQFKVKMTYNRQGTSCQDIITPLKA
jgi:hypothetical protein